MIAADLTAAAGLATIPAAAFAVVLGITKIVHDAAAISRDKPSPPAGPPSRPPAVTCSAATPCALRP
ncbi:hypothetical protein [Actinacidiphila yanglinensis]|uniref:hypothetical protein n=1 Tax=Actinacidiphila yanglinensis TaxID=310779 RepID=UPI0011B0EF71|nr:hypothetical protein [Actinacidiphila yanglinensis]